MKNITVIKKKANIYRKIKKLYIAMEKKELEVIKEHEPNLYKAVCNVFKDSYEYTRQYRQFCQEMNRKTKDYCQMTIDDFI